MNKNNLRWLTVLLVFSSCLLSACASKPRFEGKADLCGLILDENNVPVKDFVVNCTASGGKPLVLRPVITNENGLFVFYGVPSGKYILSGEKNNYLKIKHVPYAFNDRAKIICLQTKTFKGAISSAEELLRLDQPMTAGKLLGDICCETKSKEQLYIKAYQFYAAENVRKKKSLLADLKRKNKFETDFFKKYAAELSKLEEGNK